MLTKEPSFIRLIKKRGGYYIGEGEGTGVGTGIGLLIGAREVAASINDQGALGSLLYVRIISIKINDWVGSCQSGCTRGL